jgi:Xaa-Pro aminopeptidase
MLTTNTYRARLAALQEAMAADGLDALVIAGRGVIAQHGGLMFLTGYCPVVRHAFAVLPAVGEPILLVTTPADIWLAQRRSPVADIRLMQPGAGDPTGSGAALGTLLAGVARVGVVGLEDTVPAAEYLAWVGALPDTQFVSAGGLMQGVKVIKSEDDIAALRIAAEIVDDAFLVLCDALGDGASLRAATGAAEGKLRADGAIEILVYLSEHPHFLHRPTALVPPRGTLLTCFVEASTEDGHWVELARLIGVGPLDPATQRFAALSARAMRRAEEALVPGQSAGAAYAQIEEEIAQGGLTSGLWFGHGVGVDHDAPVIGRDVATLLAPGMVIALHPHLVDEASGLGASLCDTFLIGQTGAKKLSRLPRDFVTI